LVNALDDWALGASYDPDSRFEAWPLDVVRQADPDPQGWRDRIRDPLVRKNKEQLYKLADSANIETTPVNLLAALGELLQKQNGDSIPFLVKVQRRHPSDLWANFALGQYTRNPADAYRYYQAALAIRPDTPILDYDLGYTARWCGRPDEALYYCSEAVRLDPKHAKFRAGLARCLLDVGRDREAFDQARQGLELNPGIEASHSLQKTLRLYFMRQGKWDDARIAWQAALKAIPPKHDEWYGYAELCLFVGNEVEYRRGRTALLAKFGETTDPYVAERTSRACLLLPASADELRKAAVLAQRAVAVDRSKYQAVFPYFMFTQGLAEFRQARFERAISTMQGDAGQMPGPAPRLVLAMALHQNKQDAEARKTLASAILAHDWSANKVHDQDDWICHVLSREAEGMILSK
jgi:serine/threonine-protein kinase